MKKNYLIPSLFLLPLLSYAQVEKYKFQVKDEKNIIRKNLVLIANGENVITNASGIFTLTLNNSLINIAVQSPDEKKFVIRYPSSGIISLPRGAENLIEIKIAEPTKADEANTAKNQLADQITKIDKQIRNLKNDDEQLKKILLKRIDSLFAVGQKKNISRDELRTARELMVGRDTSFPKISLTLANYINEAKDLSDALKLADMALTQQGARTQLIDAIKTYNPFYEELNGKKDEYEKNVGAFWQSKELSYNFLNLADFALNEIHRPYILPLNDLIEKMNRYSMESGRKKRELKSEILAESKIITRNLDTRLVILSEKNNTLMTILKSFM